MICFSRFFHLRRSLLNDVHATLALPFLFANYIMIMMMLQRNEEMDRHIDRMKINREGLEDAHT